MEKGQKLATVEVPPYPLLRMIIRGEEIAADWARPLFPFGMFGKDVNPLRGNIQIDLGNGPWRYEAQKVTVQFGVLHGSSLSGANYTSRAYPQKTRKSRF
jgi:hypothetical protein